MVLERECHVVRSALEVREEYFRDRESEDGQDVVSTGKGDKAKSPALAEEGNEVTVLGHLSSV